MTLFLSATQGPGGQVARPCPSHAYCSQGYIATRSDTPRIWCASNELLQQCAANHPDSLSSPPGLQTSCHLHLAMCSLQPATQSKTAATQRQNAQPCAVRTSACTFEPVDWQANAVGLQRLTATRAVLLRTLLLLVPARTFVAPALRERGGP